MRKACIICDIDGVYTDSTEWSMYLPKSQDREEWDAFGKKCNLCKPNKPIIRIIQAFNKILPILFITGRGCTAGVRKETKRQISDFSNGTVNAGRLQNNKLFMRKLNDFREAWEVKEEILKKEVLPYYVPIMAIDDDPDNVEMFRKNGIFTWYYKIKR